MTNIIYPNIPKSQEQIDNEIAALNTNLDKERANQIIQGINSLSVQRDHYKKLYKRFYLIDTIFSWFGHGISGFISILAFILTLQSSFTIPTLILEGCFLACSFFTIAIEFIVRNLLSKN